MTTCTVTQEVSVANLIVLTLPLLPTVCMQQNHRKWQSTVIMIVGVVTPGKTLHADVVVLAAALGIPELTKPLGLSVPLTAKPRTVTVITKPLKPILKHIVVNGTHLMLLLSFVDPLHIRHCMVLICKKPNLSANLTFEPWKSIFVARDSCTESPVIGCSPLCVTFQADAL